MMFKIPEPELQVSFALALVKIREAMLQNARGELMFAVPSVLTNNPRLIGYYRLLYGFSQKEFYKSGIGGQFKALEVSGSLTQRNAAALSEFCRAMAEAGAFLLAGISAGKVSHAIIDDLTLLTLGPQLRGGGERQDWNGRDCGRIWGHQGHCGWCGC